MARATVKKPPARGARRGAPASAAAVVLDWAKSLLVAFILFIIIRTFLLQSFVITSGSMEPTLLVGDFLMISKLAYGPRVPFTDFRLPGYTSPGRGDIVIFEGPHEPGLDIVKRVVGVPGDTLEMRSQVLYVNGAQQPEAYARRNPSAANLTHPWMVWQRDYLAGATSPDSYRPTLHDWGPIVVPGDGYFVMGDNRDDSLDSRYWGFLPPANIKGEALFIYFSYDRDSGRPLPLLTSIRWGRIANGID